METIPDPLPGPPAYLDWNGKRWYRTRSGHYQDSSGGVLLHRAVWTAANGGIPDGHRVHHVNHDPADNRLVNLALLADRQHRQHHESDRSDPAWREAQKSEAAVRRAKGQWAKRQPVPVVCAWCGVEYESTGMRARFCTPKCAYAYRRDRARCEAGTEVYRP